MSISHNIIRVIEQGWDSHAAGEVFDGQRRAMVMEGVCSVLNGLDSGMVRAAELVDGQWMANITVKKAILLYFKLAENFVIGGGDLIWWDKFKPKTSQKDSEYFTNTGVRFANLANIRFGAYCAPGVIVMPSFINVGAYVGERTMIDSGAMVGSCAQIGSYCHISAGVNIGGVLEPLQDTPVIVEDRCFIGGNCALFEGVIVGEGAVLGFGCQVGGSTKIVDRATGKISYGHIPPYSVVIPGSIAIDGCSGVSMNCVVIIKTVDSSTRAKVAITDILRL